MKKGFTLIELLVSVAIFTIVMVVALGALLAVAESDRKAQTLKTITNNLGFALESMARNTRTGVDYHCGSLAGGDCPNGDDYFAFTPVCTQGSCPLPQTVYAFGQGSECPNDTGCLRRNTNGGAGGDWEVITAPEVIVEDTTFYLVGSLLGSADNIQPRVTITIVGYVQVSEAQQSAFNIQTTVTQRLYDQ
jgi:prepilin-type N-terminal cleavage/methylation domain-containing protein